MAFAIMPALQTGGRLALQQLPTVISAVKDKLPGMYNSVVQYTQKSGKSPEEVANRAVVKNDKILGQAVLETLMRNGVTAEFINQAAPIFTVADLKAIQVKFNDIDKAERGIADTHSAQIDGDPDAVFAHDNAHIVRLCNSMGISSSVLSDLVTFVATRGPAQIKRYQAFEKASGRKPV